MKWHGRLKRLAAFAVASASVCLSSSAFAEYRHRIVVLERATGSEPDHEIITRVRAELAAAGFEVIVLPVTEEDPKQAVEAAGRELHPASVLLVERLAATTGEDKNASAGAELWLADRMLRKTVVLRLKPERAELPSNDNASETSREAARVAVQAVELVKARLAELAVTRENEPPPPPRPSQPPAPPPEPEPRGARPNLTLGVGLLKGLQKGQQALTPLLRVGVALPERWTGDTLAIDGRGSFVGLGGASRVEHGPAAATIRHSAVSLEAVMRFLPKHRVQPFVSLGGGALVLDVAGDAPDPYRNSSERTLTGLVGVSAGIWLQPVAGVGLVLEGQLLEAWSKTVVRIAGEDAAEIAAPLLLMSAGLMVEF